MSVFRKLLVVAVASAAIAACKNDQAATEKSTGAATSGNDTTAVAETTETPSETATTSTQPEIVYVNSDSLLANYQHFKDAKVRLEAKSKRLERDLRTKAESFQKEVGIYQQNGASLTQEQRAQTEERLAQKQQQLGSQQQTASSQLANDENEEMKKIYDKVEAYLKKLSQERGYKMVLTYTRGNSAILYGDASLDITKDVVSALNTEYKKAKK